jgi:hypothetical protein
MVQLQRINSSTSRESKAVSRIVTLLKVFRSLFSEYVQVDGKEHLGNACHNDGPFLLLGKHERHSDFVNIPAHLWDHFPVKAPLKTVMRSDYFHPFIPTSVFAFLMKLSQLYHPIIRVGKMEGLSEEKRERLRNTNQEQLDQIVSGYFDGVNAFLLPEGTTKSDGRISEIKSGAYRVAQMLREDGGIDVVQCLPFGTTYDMMSGEKDRVFFRFGEPFHYEPVEPFLGENNEEYARRDRYHFGRRIRQMFRDLNTVTFSQLAGDHLLKKAKEGPIYGVTPEKLEVAVNVEIEKLCGVSGIVFDEEIMNPERAEIFYGSLIKMKYVVDGKWLVLPRITNEPRTSQGKVDLAHYKKRNPLLYMVNRWHDVIENDVEIREALKLA